MLQIVSDKNPRGLIYFKLIKNDEKETEIKRSMFKEDLLAWCKQTNQVVTDLTN